MISNRIPCLLTTSRLKISSPPKVGDDEHIAALLSNEGCMLYLTAMSKRDVGGWSLNDAKRRREYQAVEQMNERGWFCCISEQLTTNFVGICGLRTIDWSNRSAEMGIILHPDSWGKKYSIEAHLAILGTAFMSLKLHRICFVTSERNHPMISFCRNVLGANHDGTMKDAFALSYDDPAEGYENALMFSLLSTQWSQTEENLRNKLAGGDGLRSIPTSTLSPDATNEA